MLWDFNYENLGHTLLNWSNLIVCLNQSQTSRIQDSNDLSHNKLLIFMIPYNNLMKLWSGVMHNLLSLMFFFSIFFSCAADAVTITPPIQPFSVSKLLIFYSIHKDSLVNTVIIHYDFLCNRRYLYFYDYILGIISWNCDEE